MDNIYCKQCGVEVECNLTFHKGFNSESLKDSNKMIKGYYHFCSTKCIKQWETENVKTKEIKSGDARFARFDCGGNVA